MACCSDTEEAPDPGDDLRTAEDQHDADHDGHHPPPAQAAEPGHGPADHDGHGGNGGQDGGKLPLEGAGARGEGTAGQSQFRAEGT